MYYVKFVVFTGCIKYLKVRRVNTHLDELDVRPGFYNVSLSIDDFGFTQLRLTPGLYSSNLGHLGEYLFTFRGLLSGHFTNDGVVLFGSAFQYIPFTLSSHVVLLFSRSVAIYNLSILEYVL